MIIGIKNTIDFELINLKNSMMLKRVVENLPLGCRNTRCYPLLLKWHILSLIGLFVFTNCHGRESKKIEKEIVEIHDSETLQIKTGAEQTEKYFDLLIGKKIGIVTNQTGVIGKVHLVDTLLQAGFDVMRIFAPEHGFRGHAEAGEKVASSIDSKTGVQVVSLYGSNFKPDLKDVMGIDIMIFDIQDVGARFYTYISTLHYIMEACAQANTPLLILDRPNPNGFYVDGPLLRPEFTSFIGMHPIPIVHGMTIGELARMIQGESWLNNGLKCEMTIIPILNYSHADLYQLPIPPSPNLQSMSAIYLYPSLCLFEGTVMSVGRGTDFPFEVFGHPLFSDGTFSFTPESRPGFAAKPPFMGKVCYGLHLTDYVDTLLENPRIELKWLIRSYELLHDKTSFFQNNMFDKLTGSSELRKQITSGVSEEHIRAGWKSDVDNFKAIRTKYLLYDDFE
jgi:uncharacterized protein YbbC (DUF1343 family)